MRGTKGLEQSERMHARSSRQFVSSACCASLVCFDHACGWCVMPYRRARVSTRSQIPASEGGTPTTCPCGRAATRRRCITGCSSATACMARRSSGRSRGTIRPRACRMALGVCVRSSFCVTVFGSPLLLLCFFLCMRISSCAHFSIMSHTAGSLAQCIMAPRVYAAGQVMHRIGVPQVGVFGYALR